MYVTVKDQSTAARMRTTCDFPPLPAKHHVYVPGYSSLQSMAEPVLRTVKFGEWKVGDSFDSFAELQQKIQALQDETAVQMYRREGKTLVASM